MVNMCGESGGNMKTWYAFELLTSGSIYMGAFEVQSEYENELYLISKGLEEYLEGGVVGTVEAETWQIAMDSIRMGDWDFDVIKFPEGE